jgi:glycine/D-amino acid oxidase-like deaminating enzyme
MAANTFAPPSSLLQPHLDRLPRTASVIVVGAGAFGGWTALHLLRRGLHVTLVDAWGPGHSRSSSADETRVIRSTYGSNKLYFDLNVRALQLWKENEAKWNKKLLHPVGVLWLCYKESTPLVDDSIPFAEACGMPYQYLDLDALRRRYPLVNTEDLHHGWLDPHAGYLMARESTRAVAEAFVREGGTFLQAHARPGKIIHGKMQDIALSIGVTLQADAYVFACGSWMGQVFPEVLGNVITCTKQEAYYFGVPQSDSEAYDAMPAWVDVDGDDYYYGIPGNASRGFKIGVDRRGEAFDPTHGERLANPQVLERARKFIAHRFPGLKNAPLVENRVCPYENSPDGNFIFDKHPEASNVIFLGGGSGHGFKHGPALGEHVANTLVER